MNINTGLVILLMIAIFALGHMENKRARALKAWQTNWEQNGELPLDRVQNRRLNNLEVKVFGYIQDLNNTVH